jgi:hypothetical protein
MIAPVSMRAQRGATLIVGLIMLVLLTLLVTSAFMLSTGNLKAVGNMQFRSEAIAAANKRIEEVLSTDFTAGPIPTVKVDIDGDGNGDYDVAIDPPECIRATVALLSTESSKKLPAMSTASHWNTTWDIEAVVNDALTGASIRIRQGARLLLDKSKKESLCP